ncbi:MAG: class I SAM-dependent methyltransferase [Chloroflexi bacterium]|nr:class I SAM-dependent methyltransferase [Chloroflexota bacterium]
MAKRRWLIALAVGGALIYEGWRRGVFEPSLENMRRFGLPSTSLYDVFASALFAGFFTRVAEEIAAAQPSGAALDAGSGPGHLSVRLGQIAQGLTITGVDIDASMVELAIRRAREARVADRVHFEVGDVGALPFPDRQFDIVFSTFSLHHWPDPAQALAEVYRVLRPGGCAYIYDVAHWLQHVERHGLDVAQLLAGSAFQQEACETIVRMGPVPLVKRNILRKVG